MRDPASGALYLFGGESYKPYMYHNAIDQLTLSNLPIAGGAPGSARDPIPAEHTNAARTQPGTHASKQQERVAAGTGGGSAVATAPAADGGRLAPPATEASSGPLFTLPVHTFCSHPRFAPSVRTL